MIPVSLRAQIEKEVKACIVEEGRSAEECIISTARHSDLSKEQAQELYDDMKDLESE